MMARTLPRACGFWLRLTSGASTNALRGTPSAFRSNPASPTSQPKQLHYEEPLFDQNYFRRSDLRKEQAKDHVDRR
jgi:hypothetical protein